MGDTNRTAVRYIPEASWSVIPALALINSRILGESLNADVGYVASNELRSDAQAGEPIQVSQEANGGYTFELSYEAFDAFFELFLRNDYATAVAIAAAVDIAVDGTANTFTSTTTDFVAEGLVPGQFFKVAGFATGANNGVFLVGAVTANLLTLAGGANVTTEAAGASVSIDSQRLVNSTLRKSMYIEKQFEDLTPDVFIGYPGMRGSDMTITMNSQEPLTGSFTFLGQRGIVAAATAGTGAPTAAPTHSVLNAAANIGTLLEGGLPLGAGEFIRNLTISIANNLRGKPALQLVGNADIGMGRIIMTGTLQAYFETKDMYEKYLNDVSSSFAVVVQDALGQGYGFHAPRFKFTSGQVVAGGPDEDVIANMEYQAYPDPVLGYTFQLTSFDGEDISGTADRLRLCSTVRRY